MDDDRIPARVSIGEREVRRLTLQCYLKALLIALLVAISPFTPDDALRSVIGGAFVALVYLLFIAKPESKARREERERRPARDWVFLGSVLLLFLAVFFPTIQWFYERWTQSIWNDGHGLFVPFVMYYMARRILTDQSAVIEDASLLGLAFLIPGLSLVMLDAGIHTHYIAGIGLVLSLPGLSLLILGKKRTKALTFVFVLGAFLVPLPAVVSNAFLLRDITAHAVAMIYRSLGFTVVMENKVLYFSDLTFLIADTCSGYALLTAGAAIALILVYLTPSRIRGALVILAVFPVALATNIARSAILIALTMGFGTGILHSPIHPGTGVAAFMVSAMGLGLIAGYPTTRGSRK